MKRCTGPCGQRKPFAEFSKRSRARDGLQAWCKECVKLSQQGNAKPKDPTRQRIARLKHLYGLTVDEWERMLIDQAGRCALCDEPMQNPHTDHSHDTGKVRALLCLGCNVMLGRVERIGISRIERYLQ